MAVGACCILKVGNDFNVYLCSSYMLLYRKSHKADGDVPNIQTYKKLLSFLLNHFHITQLQIPYLKQPKIKIEDFLDAYTSL
jgi:hypothetical protein